MKLSDDARQAIHDWRWGPYIDDPIERQEVVDAMIATIMDAFNQLEAKNAKLKREIEEYENEILLKGARVMKLSEQMKEREKMADISDGADSPFITMDRRVWLDYANKVAQLEAELLEQLVAGEKLYISRGALSELLSHLVDVELERDKLADKLRNIECAECGLTMLECKCDET